MTATLVPPDVVLDWVDNADNNSCYMIWRSDDGTNFDLIDTIGDLENYIDTTAIPGVKYWYKVQACDAEGNTSNFSNTVETGFEFTPIEYGLLYNYYAASGDGGAHDIAPAGWHVMTEAEWTTFYTFLGGQLVAGGKLKETGTTHWNTPNTGATNEVGFNAKPGGNRNPLTGNFATINTSAWWWCGDASTEFDAQFNSVILYEGIGVSEKFGYSIRCIKDDSDDPGMVVDYDDNIYPTVKIGTQVLMAQNLIVKHYNDGIPIPEVQDAGDWIVLGTGAWCYYDNDSGNM